MRSNLGEEVKEPQHLDNANFIASITDPQIRRDILENMQDEELALLPPNLIGEARRYRRERHEAER